MIDTLKAVSELTPGNNRPFFSATHQEISSAATTDIYFVKTMEILDRQGLKNIPVTAEIFPRRPGVFAGLPEMLALLPDKGLEVWALAEGEEFAAKEVIMCIRGSYGAFGLMETPLLGIAASSSGWASAARAIKNAAGDSTVTCFGARHLHPAVAPVMERSALIGGLDGASCILGAKLAGRKPSGTAPHSLILIMGDTVAAAKAYNQAMPPEELRLMLADTFKDEAEETMRLARALGDDLFGVRLDTPSERGGVTVELVREIRCRLDMENFSNVKIFVSGGLDPVRLQELKEAGAAAFGVGSYISAAPPIDMTMDLKEIEGRPIAKRGRIPGVTPNPRLKLIRAK